MATVATAMSVVPESSELVQARLLLELYRPLEAKEALQQVRMRSPLLEELVVRVDSQIDALQRLFADLDDKTRWSLLTTRGGIIAYSRYNAGTTMLSARLEARIDCSALEVCATLLEHDLYHEWMPYIESVNTLLDKPHAKVLHAVVGGLPWPLSSLISRREAVAVGVGQDLLDTPRRSIVLTVHPVTAAEEQQLDQPVPPLRPGIIRVGMGLCGAEVKPINRDSCNVAVVGTIDPRVPLFPSWAFAFAVRCVAHRVFYELRAACARPVNRDRVLAKPAFYGAIRRSLAKHDLLPSWA